MVGSVFLEKTEMGDRFGITVGIDNITFDDAIDTRSISQDASGAAAGGKSPQSTGTNSVEGTVEKHRTIYLQPGMRIGDSSMVYVTYGFVSADLNGRSSNLSSTDINETKSLDGEKMGIGIKRVADNGLVLKLDVSETSYDAVSFTTSNNTTATADLDNTAVALSIGKQF